MQLRPDWLDERLYPFAPHVLETDAGRMHYVDEGAGPPVVLVHGNPTWSFQYRHLIAGLRDRRRCVAPDLPGFGLSAKSPHADYRAPGAGGSSGAAHHRARPARGDPGGP